MIAAKLKPFDPDGPVTTGRPTVSRVWNLLLVGCVLWSCVWSYLAGQDARLAREELNEVRRDVQVEREKAAAHERAMKALRARELTNQALKAAKHGD